MSDTDKLVEKLLENKELRRYLKALLNDQQEKLLAELDARLSGKLVNQGELEEQKQKVRELVAKNSEQLACINSLTTQKNNLEKDKSNLALALRQKEGELDSYKRDAQAELTKLKDDYTKDVEEARDIARSLNKDNEKLHKELKQWQDSYLEMDTAYKNYQGLSQDMKERLEKIFSGTGLVGFLKAGFDWDNVKALWQFIKTRIKEEDAPKDVAKLILIFEFIFNLYKENTIACPFELLEPRLGERYDRDFHAIKGQKTDGKICKVFLKGILENGRVLFKAFVDVE